MHDDLEGIFTVIGKTSPGNEGLVANRFTLSSEFAEDSEHHASAAAKEQVDHDLLTAESYLNKHIKGVLS